MSKKEADEIFVELLPFLQRMAKGTSFKMNKTLTTDLIVNEAYLHVYKNLDKINDPKDLEKMAVNFIVKNIGWANSQINKQERVNVHDEQVDYDDEDNTNEQIDTTEEDLEDKIEIEQWYNNKLSILQMYRNQEKDKIKQIIFDCYFNKGITKGIAMAKHLNINKNAGCQLVKQMKQDIKQYQTQITNNIK
jgi:hypothetical protein